MASKALPQGGAGGRQPTRELFDTLLLWQARVPLDADGTATVEVPLNDSITAFRIVAVASGGEALFGTGATSIRTTQDLMVLPGIAPLAREGDRMRSEVTLRNATDRPMDVVVTGAVTGLGATLERREVTLAPGQAQAVGWDVVVPAGVTSLRWELEAARARRRGRQGRGDARRSCPRCRCACTRPRSRDGTVRCASPSSAPPMRCRVAAASPWRWRPRSASGSARCGSG